MQQHNRRVRDPSHEVARQVRGEPAAAGLDPVLRCATAKDPNDPRFHGHAVPELQTRAMPAQALSLWLADEET